jgi:Cyclin, N-terminal domain
MLRVAQYPKRAIMWMILSVTCTSSTIYQCSLLNMSMLVQLIPESLFLAIYILDRFLSKQEVERKNLQLVRCTSLCKLFSLVQFCPETE